MPGFKSDTPNTNKQKSYQNGPKLLEAAVRAHKIGDIKNAESLYLNSINSGFEHEVAFSNLGVIYKTTNRKEKAIAMYERAIAKNPSFAEGYSNLGNLYRDVGKLDKALAATLQSLELKPANPEALLNLGAIYKDLGNIDQALVATLKSLELKPNNSTAYMNLGGIYKSLGNLDQALASTLKSLELKPEESQALCKLGLIRMALGQTKEARKILYMSIERNNQEYEAYHALSTMLETKKDAEEVMKLMGSVKTSDLAPQTRALAEFAVSNCLHKLQNYELASKHLRLANKSKLTAFPADTDTLLHQIKAGASNIELIKEANIEADSGKERIFITGMPRSGTTLLETILSMNAEIKDLGESRSMENAISKMQKQKEQKYKLQNLNELYSEMEPFDESKYRYTTDKYLYNFIHINWIAVHMPAAKIIHCRRNAMDNILSIFRSNLMGGTNNYTASLEDSVNVLIAHEKAMQIHKKNHPSKIFTFDYDQFVNFPEDNLRKLLIWLDLDFDYNYLHPEKSTRSINTASVMQARRRINNKSVGGWKNYEKLLQPALRLLQKNGIPVE